MVALVGLVAASWLPAFDLPLGDNHEGRILGRFGLQVRNFQELGMTGSGFASDWSPYAGSNYAHHPPLVNGLHVAISSLFGTGEWQLRLLGYFSGPVTIVGMAVLLRDLRLRWSAVLLAIAVTISTGYFWLFGRLGLGIALIVWTIVAIRRLVEATTPSGRLTGGAALLSFVTVVSSWQGMALGALLGIWLWRRRGFDGPTLIVGTAMTLAALAVGMWIASASGIGSLIAHVEDRSSEVEFGLVEFVVRQLAYFWLFLPVWYLALTIPALIAGLRNEATRVLTAITFGITVLFSLVLFENSYVHEYWNYPLLLPVAIGMAVLFDRWIDSGRRRPMVGLWLIGLAAAGWIGFLSLGGTSQERFDGPASAGSLVQIVAPAPGQDRAFFAGVAAPRWLSYYWDLPVGPLTPDLVQTLPAETRAIVYLEDLPSWIPDDVDDDAVAVEGDYAVVEVGALR